MVIFFVDICFLKYYSHESFLKVLALNSLHLFYRKIIASAIVASLKWLTFSNNNENVVNAYNGYLLTDVYADLLAIKEESETLPVNKNLFIVIGLEQIPANKKSVAALEGVDKKAFSAFLKSEKIKWNDPQDLVKVLDYISSVR